MGFTLSCIFVNIHWFAIPLSAAHVYHKFNMQSNLKA